MRRFYNPLKSLYDWVEDRMNNETLDTTSPNILERGSQILSGCIKTYLQKQMRELRRKTTYDLKQGYYNYINTDYKRQNPGLNTYRLQEIKKPLRQELQVRTGYALALIKTQTEQNLNKLKGRFIDWINQQTLGDDKQSLKEMLDLDKLRYQNKRHQQFIITDQYHKMIGNFDDIVANHFEALGFIWKNRKDKRVAGNPTGINPKPDKNSPMHGNHWVRENKIYLYEQSWAKTAKLIKAPDGYEVSDLKDGPPGMPIGCRCYRVNLYELNELPKDYLTEKGKKYLRDQVLDSF